MTFRRVAESVSTFAGSPWAFALAALSAFWWGRDAVPLMLLVLLQNSQNRATRAIHIKLDELVEALPQPDSRKAHIEERLD